MPPHDSAHPTFFPESYELIGIDHASGPAEPVMYVYLPAPTQPWQGDLHRTFSAGPADTSRAALRLKLRACMDERDQLRDRVAQLEAQVKAVSTAAEARALEGWYRRPASSGTAPRDFEMAAWPDAPEAPRLDGRIMRAMRWIGERLAA